MNQSQPSIHCQIADIHAMGEWADDGPPVSVVRRIKLAVRRRLDPGQERKLKQRTNDLMNRFSVLVGRPVKPAVHVTIDAADRLEAGDLVRVRSQEEIEATLNNWRQLKGCTFMPEMREYCGTTHRVLKRMERFVDERDLRAKKSKGIVLLEDVICHGTMEFGRCDRACFLFWREEWLEKIDGGPA